MHAVGRKVGQVSLPDGTGMASTAREVAIIFKYPACMYVFIYVSKYLFLFVFVSRYVSQVRSGQARYWGMGV
jgi:hypothetical protein